MAKGYSVDLRERVIAASQRGGLTDEEAAKLFQIGEATVHRWKRLKRETGGLEPRPYGGGVPAADLGRSGATRAPDGRRAARPHGPGGGVGVPPPHGHEREPRDDGSDAAKARPHAKKETLTATEQASPRIQELRCRFTEISKDLDPTRLIFIDEAASHIAMTREYARAPRGERAHGTVPRNAGTVTTMIGALDLWGVRAMMTVEGATDAEVFETFVERVLAKKLRHGDIVVLDNVGAHRTERVRELIRATGASVLYLPPYSPDLNPIEIAWSKLKELLREFGARTRDALDEAIHRAMDLIDGADAAAWFAHCGHSGQLK
jgi:transposase/transposase-like protein